MSPGLSMNWLVRQSVLHSTGLAKYMLLRFNGSEVGSKCFGFGLFTVTLQTHQPPRVHPAKHQRMHPVVAGEKDSAHSTLELVCDSILFPSEADRTFS